MNPNKRGPVELQMLEMARQAKARGWRFVVAFSAAAPDWYASAMREAGAVLSPIASPATAGRDDVSRLLARERPDIVHLHFVPARRVRWIRGAEGAGAVLRTEHTWLARSRLPRRLARWAGMRWIEQHIAVSQAIARQLRREYFIDVSAIQVIFNGVDVERFRPRPEKYELRRRLLALGEDVVVVALAANLIPRKRVDLFISAIPDVLARAPATQFVIAGDGPERSRLEVLIEALGVERSARILSGDNDISRLYAASDIAALTSWGEGLPGAGLEALASGLPLVAADVDGLNEVPEDGVSGIIVRDQTAGGLADAIAALALDAGRRQELGRAARARALELFDLRVTASATLDLYPRLLARPGARVTGATVA